MLLGGGVLEGLLMGLAGTFGHEGVGVVLQGMLQFSYSLDEVVLVHCEDLSE